MDKNIVRKEIKLKAIRSSGAGGQHVNKVSTKIELSYDLDNSKGLTEDEKTRAKEKLKSRLTLKGLIIIQSQESRSLIKNKKVAIQRLFEMLENALIVPKRRKKTKPTLGSQERRLVSKRIKSLKKELRTKPNSDF